MANHRPSKKKVLPERRFECYCLALTCSTGFMGTPSSFLDSLHFWWEAYSSMGNVVKGTKFIAFKVPLKESLCSKYNDESLMFSPGILLEDTFQQNVSLGLIIDLTFTTRYYDPQEFTDQCIEYKKIFVPGHILPPKDIVLQFYKAVDDFLQNSSNKDKLIGIHCTHGVNRTGYFICRYLIEKLGHHPDRAIKAVGDARGYPIERQNYLEDLRKRSINTSPDIEGEDFPDDMGSREETTGDEDLQFDIEHIDGMQSHTSSGIVGGVNSDRSQQSFSHSRNGRTRGISKSDARSRWNPYNSYAGSGWQRNDGSDASHYGRSYKSQKSESSQVRYSERSASDYNESRVYRSQTGHSHNGIHGDREHGNYGNQNNGPKHGTGRHHDTQGRRSNDSGNGWNGRGQRQEFSSGYDRRPAGAYGRRGGGGGGGYYAGHQGWSVSSNQAGGSDYGQFGHRH